MKRIFTMTTLVLAMLLGSSLRNNISAQYSGNTPYSGDVSYQAFYDQLSPYGQWIDYPEYGYVWQPDLGNDFRPYSTGGHWVWTDDYEWMWVSDYDWGWAPFHYGRWFSDPSYGWLWMPGYEWAPAWVTWRSGGDYYGWAPLRPGINVGIDFSVGSYNPPDDYWCFAPSRYITSPRIYDYCFDRSRNVTIINNTTIINNFSYNRNVFVTGPRRNDAERYTGLISPVRFRESQRPGRSEFRNNEIAIFRPHIQRNDNSRFTPRHFERYNRQPQNNDNRIGRNDDHSGRNGNDDIRGNNTVNNPGNNLPVRRERNENSTVDGRNDNGVRQPQANNDRSNEPRRNVFDRNNGNNRHQERNEEAVVRPFERPVRSDPGNNNNRNFDRRNFENRNNNRDISNNNNTPVRQTGPETRNDNNNNQQQRQPFRQMERPVQQQQPRQMERPVQQQQQPRQMERPVQQQQQPRQFEKRNDDNRQQGNGGNNERGHNKRG